MKNFSRRDFLKFSVAGAAGVATVLNFPMLRLRLALASPGSNFFTIAVISDTQNYVDVNHTQPLNENFFISQTNPTSAVRRVKLLIFHNLRSKVVTTKYVFQIFGASSI